MGCLFHRFFIAQTASVEDAENYRHKKQCGNRGKKQSTDDRASQWGILFTAFAESERHGQHADHHRECRHNDRANTSEAGF